TSGASVIKERIPSNGSVIITRSIEGKRSIPHTRVTITIDIAEEGVKPNSYVLVTRGIVKQRLRTDGRGLIPANIAEKRFVTNPGVLVAIRIVKECLDSDTHVPDSGSDVCERIFAHSRVLPTANAGRVWTPRFERRRECKAAERNC